MLPATSRVPIPFEAVCMMVMQLYARGRPEEALAILTCFELYLRPGEVETIKVGHLIAPTSRHVAGRTSWTVLLHPREDDVPSKTAEFDETLALDLERHVPLGIALSALARRRPQDEPLFRLDARRMAEAFKSTAKELGIAEIGIVHCYQLRHGGASHDFSAKERSLTEVMRRGRWRSWHSVRRYEKGARTVEVVSRLTSSQREFAVKCVADVPAVISGRRSPYLAPWLSKLPSKSSRARGGLEKRLLKKVSESCCGTSRSGKSTTSRAKARGK